MNFAKSTIPVLAALLLVGTFATTSAAAKPEGSREEASRSATDAPADAQSKAWPWRFHVNVYGWLPKAPAQIKVDDHDVVNLPESFGTILHSLEMAAMFELEVHKGPIGVFVSPVYYKGEDDEKFTGALGARRKFSVDEKVWIITYGVSYDFGPWQLDQLATFPTVIVQPYVGALYLHDDIELKVKPGVLDRGLDVDTTLEFNTPIVGANTIWDLSQRWAVRFGVNYGGWDVDDVDKTYEIMSVVGYRFKMWKVSSSAFAGYRYLHIDYKKKGIDVKVTVKGPFFGIGWEF